MRNVIIISKVYITQRFSEVNLSPFVYRLFHEDFSPVIERYLVETYPFTCLIYKHVEYITYFYCDIALHFGITSRV